MLKKVLNGLYNQRFLLLVMMVAVAFSSLLYDKTMPMAEGWYTYYAELINSGQAAYKDFDYLFSPFYINLIAVITRIFGYEIIVLRTFGVIFYAMIAGIMYLIFAEVFEKNIACVGTVVGILFLQSEWAQIFNDYIRVMDIFSCLTTLFLIKFVKKTMSERKALLIAGVCNAFFMLIKQNMGLIYWAYAFILIIAVGICQREKTKTIVKNVVTFMVGFLVPVVIMFGSMAINGELELFLKLTAGDALAAKGGLMSVLFGWISLHWGDFKSNTAFWWDCISIFIILFLLNKHYRKEQNEKIHNIVSVLFAIIAAALFTLFGVNEALARKFENGNYLSTYGLFLVVFSMFVFFVFIAIYKWIKKEEIPSWVLQYITLTGAYFALSYGCGTSSGLAEGQAGLGIAFMVCFVLSNMNFKFGTIVRIGFVFICLLMTLQYGEKKMARTYYWWGMDDAMYWHNNYTTDKVPLLKGIWLSESTRDAYETIYDVVQTYSKPDEPIYCFPQIPIIYSLCDREDPGVRAKVQWFDVVSDSSIDSDIEVLKQNPPKVIVIYNTFDFAYDQHESMFRNGQISGTRKMRNFLMDFVWDNGYTCYGTVSFSYNNSVTLYYKDDTKADDVVLKGSGTQENPYIIDSPETLLALAEQVNAGRDFRDKIIKQTCDIDMSECENWIPIGLCDSGKYFWGLYDGGGHAIKNLNSRDCGNTGLFGMLGGTVCNLSIQGGTLDGINVGAIASASADESARIINCYTNVTVNAERAGGIADNFTGRIINVYSAGTTYGKQHAGVISFISAEQVINAYALDESILNGKKPGGLENEAVQTVSKEFMTSEEIIKELNAEIDATEHCLKHFAETQTLIDENWKTFETWMAYTTLCRWTIGEDGYPVFE